MLQKDIDLYDERADFVRLMTLHASKGLEFPVVFIIGNEDGIIPYRRDGIVTDLEEEKRLLYVGMTRAQRLLYLTRAEKRMLYGKVQTSPPCPFLVSVASELFESIDPDRPRRKNDQMSLF